MAATIEDGVDSRGRDPVGIVVFPSLGSFMALKVVIALNFPPWAWVRCHGLQSPVLSEVRKVVQGKNVAIYAEQSRLHRVMGVVWNLSQVCL